MDNNTFCSPYIPRRFNSCCLPNAYDGYNLYVANPFDQRRFAGQYNDWCSNDLILKDKDLRGQARIQPLDMDLSNTTRNYSKPY